MTKSETRSDSASPQKDVSLIAQVEAYIKRLMKGIPVILRVEHDDGSSNEEIVTKSAICTGILNRNLESVKFIPLKEEESTDNSKEPGIVIELQDVDRVICLNETHPSVVLVIPKYDRYVEIVSSGVEDFKAWYATLRMLCPDMAEDDSSIMDDSGDASSDSYGASSPGVAAKARMPAMKSFSPGSDDSSSRGLEERQLAQINALKQIISSQGRLIDALRRDRDRMQMLEVQNKDLVRVLKGKARDQHGRVDGRLPAPDGPAGQVEKSESKVNTPLGVLKTGLPPQRSAFAPKPRSVPAREDSGSEDDSSGVDVEDLDNSELDILMSYLDDKLAMLKKIGKDIGSCSSEEEKAEDNSDEEDAAIDATLENVVAEEAEITKLQDELDSLQKQKVALQRVLDRTALRNIVKGHE
ncbi:hypothetical protein FOL47_001554 [Perkinsus chesapeaki]|uniref:Uncharacterized protein n=1 Tax=Perkinsus chesapeaki TaxID=330153 RepID=A0A7J6MK49_PERCH|nr:hypothetical protein FOL47_001554 [Perkinsus chesapeaki]